jgi:hypothetical protein
MILYPVWSYQARYEKRAMTSQYWSVPPQRSPAAMGRRGEEAIHYVKCMLDYQGQKDYF